MSLASALASGRRAAEARMTSTANIRRITGKATDADGFEVPAWTTVYTGRCRIGGTTRGQSSSRSVTVGGIEVEVAVRVAHFPVDTDLRDGDLVEVTAGDTAPSVWRVVEGDPADQQTALRVPVLATNRPKEW